MDSDHEAIAAAQYSRIAWLCFADTHPTLPGHFPGRPLIPGVVLLAEVQALLSMHWPQHQLASLPQVKFTTPVRANDMVLLAVTSLTEIADSLRGNFLLRCSGQRIAQGSFIARQRNVA